MPMPAPKRQEKGRELRHCWKRRLLYALIFDVPNLANSSKLSQSQSNGRCPFGICYRTYFLTAIAMHHCVECISRVYVKEMFLIHISAWASALLVLDRWAMLEPWYVGRATEYSDPRFFVLIW